MNGEVPCFSQPAASPLSVESVDFALELLVQTLELHEDGALAAR